MLNMGIFKYYSPQNYNFIAFCKNQIFFSRPSNLNDPFDTSDLLIRPYRKFCDAVGLDNPRPLFEKLGVCCFTKADKADNGHFWSLYANSYKGYALEFNEDKFNDRGYAPLHIHKVTYSKMPFNLNNFSNSFVSEDGIDYTISSCIRDYRNGNSMSLERLFQYILLYKDSTIWKAEDEYRMIIGSIRPPNWELQELKNGYLFTLLSANTIKSVTIGHYMEKCDKQMLKNCAEHKGIPIYEAIPCIERNKWTVKIVEFK